MNEDRVFICRFAMRPCLIVSSNNLGRDKPIMGFSMSCFQCDKILSWFDIQGVKGQTFLRFYFINSFMISRIFELLFIYIMHDPG